MKSKLAKALPHDKLLHFCGGLIIGLYSKRIASIWLGAWMARLAAMAVVILVAIGIELIYDKWMKKGISEAMDVVWTTAGGIVAMI